MAQMGMGLGLSDLARLKEGESMRSSSSDPNWQNGNGDARPIAPGETLVIADLEGPGVIRHIWNTIAAQERDAPRLVVIRMYWDGEENPSVESPLGDFFGIGHGRDVPFVSLPVMVSSEGRARNCYWPMPFRKSAKITITNEGRKPVGAFYYYVDWRKVPELPEDTAYFHAMYRQEHPTVMGRNYLIADIEGRGHYVGTVQSVRTHTPHWYGEGDDFFFIDGEKEPRLRGTGTEDYFCDAWGFREATGPFYGIPLWEGYEAWSCGSVYRWHIADPVIFHKSLRVEIEHKGVTFNEDGSIKTGFGEREDDMSSVAFWYQLEPHKPFPPMAPAYERVYYDYDNVVEVEKNIDQAKATSGNVSVQKGMWAGDGQIFWQPTEKGQVLTVPFSVDEAGSYLFLLWLTHSYDYGTFQIEVDGKPLGAPLDLFNKSVVVREHRWPARTLDAGPHTLTFRNVGKNSDSKGYFLGFDSYMLTRID